MRKTTLAVTSALTLLSLPSFAAPYAADARSHGMGNTGVVSADYLTAPLHNPALGALYRENDDIGLLIPAFGVNIHDEDDALSTVDDVQDLYDSIQGLPTPADEAAMNRLLDQLDSSMPIVINGGLTFAIAIPTRFMSMNLFSAGYVEILAAPDISDATNTAERYLNSAVNLAAQNMASLYQEPILLADKPSPLASHLNINNLKLTPNVQRLMTLILKITTKAKSQKTPSIWMLASLGITKPFVRVCPLKMCSSKTLKPN